MTYKEIAEKIAEMPLNRQKDDASVLLITTDEVMPIMDFVIDWEVNESDREAMGINQVDGVLDNDHPFFTISY